MDRSENFAGNVKKIKNYKLFRVRKDQIGWKDIINEVRYSLLQR